jgi:hypothetical protein
VVVFNSGHVKSNDVAGSNSMQSDVDAAAKRARPGLIRAPQNFFAGVGLIALGLFAIWAISNLPQGTLGAMGPAMLPRWLAIAVGVCGAALLVTSLVRDGAPLERWYLRGPILVCIAIGCFAFTIRLFGLAVAGPLALMISGYASEETRPRELIIFAVLMTAFCIVLFRYLLNQPMPILIVPGTSIYI